MDTTGAITFKSPIAMVARAIPPESRTPRRGFPYAPYPFAKGRRKGNMRSSERDCRMRGAPRKEAMADERVAAKTPALMRDPRRATSFMAP